jgi:hypothetical protein
MTVCVAELADCCVELTRDWPELHARSTDLACPTREAGGAPSRVGRGMSAACCVPEWSMHAVAREPASHSPAVAPQRTEHISLRSRAYTLPHAILLDAQGSLRFLAGELRHRAAQPARAINGPGSPSRRAAALLDRAVGHTHRSRLGYARDLDSCRDAHAHESNRACRPVQTIMHKGSNERTHGSKPACDVIDRLITQPMAAGGLTDACRCAPERTRHISEIS